jgi:alkylated DNA repair dioxygenase AlkB
MPRGNILAGAGCIFRFLTVSDSFLVLGIIMTHPSGTSKRAASSDMRQFFPTTKHAKQTTKDSFGEHLGSELGAQPVYLTNKSWFILAKEWMPAPSPDAFEKEWNLHPENRHPLKLFGKTVYEKRWSQSWGVSYSYSGSVNPGRPNEESEMVQLLLRKANELTRPLQNENDSSPFNGCLQNWYEPNDTIGLHADDEKAMRQEYPIFSLSWGGTRRFLFRERQTKKKTELWLEDGDLLVMGGSCQETHQHEVPKRRVTMDPPTSNRINWTIRAFHAPHAVENKQEKKENVGETREM